MFSYNRIQSLEKTAGNYNSNNPKDEGNDAKLQSGREETIEEHEQSIYKGLLSTQIKLVKSFSLLTSAIGLSCQPILLYQVNTTIIEHN